MKELEEGVEGPEAGHFWVTAANRRQLPNRYRQWARMTVVGRVIGVTNQEPILLLMYVPRVGLLGQE